MKHGTHLGILADSDTRKLSFKYTSYPKRNRQLFRERPTSITAWLRRSPRSNSTDAKQCAPTAGTALRRRERCWGPAGGAGRQDALASTTMGVSAARRD